MGRVPAANRSWAESVTELKWESADGKRECKGVSRCCYSVKIDRVGFHRKAYFSVEDTVVFVFKLVPVIG